MAMLNNQRVDDFPSELNLHVWLGLFLWRTVSHNQMVFDFYKTGYNLNLIIHSINWVISYFCTDRTGSSGHNCTTGHVSR